MHRLTLVTGEKVDEQLWTFSIHNEVKSYEVFLSDDEVRDMAESYDIRQTDLATLAAKMMDWQKEEVL
jgi:hypothetical protein